LTSIAAPALIALLVNVESVTVVEEPCSDSIPVALLFCNVEPNKLNVPATSITRPAVCAFSNVKFCTVNDAPDATSTSSGSPVDNGSVAGFVGLTDDPEMIAPPPLVGPANVNPVNAGPTSNGDEIAYVPLANETVSPACAQALTPEEHVGLNEFCSCAALLTEMFAACAKPATNNEAANPHTTPTNTLSSRRETTSRPMSPLLLDACE
jgi:hypothetical protein